MPFRNFSKLEIGQYFSHQGHEWVKTPVCRVEEDNLAFNAFQRKTKNQNLPLAEHTTGVRSFEEMVLVEVGNSPEFAKWAKDYGDHHD